MFDIANIISYFGLVIAIVGLIFNNKFTKECKSDLHRTRIICLDVIDELIQNYQEALSSDLIKILDNNLTEIVRLIQANQLNNFNPEIAINKAINNKRNFNKIINLLNDINKIDRWFNRTKIIAYFPVLIFFHTIGFVGYCMWSTIKPDLLLSLVIILPIICFTAIVYLEKIYAENLFDRIKKEYVVPD